MKRSFAQAFFFFSPCLSSTSDRATSPPYLSLHRHALSPFIPPFSLTLCLTLPTLLFFFYLLFPHPQLCVAVLRGTLCCPQPLSAVLRVLLLWPRLFLSSFTTTTLYYPPLPTTWQVHILCTTCLPFCRPASPSDSKVSPSALLTITCSYFKQ